MRKSNVRKVEIAHLQNCLARLATEKAKSEASAQGEITKLHAELVLLKQANRALIEQATHHLPSQADEFAAADWQGAV